MALRLFNGRTSAILQWDQEIVMADPATSYRIERRVDGGTWTTVEDDYAGLEYRDTGVLRGSKAEYRIVAKNSGGEAAGVSQDIPAVGTAKPGTKIPAGTYDDPPLGTGPLFSCKQYFNKLPNGSAFYTYDRFERSEEALFIDPDALDGWRTGAFYRKDDRITFTFPISTTAVTIAVTNMYRALQGHTSNPANAPDQDGAPWEFIGLYNTTYIPADAPTPPGPTPPPTDTADPRPPAASRTTISMDKWFPADFSEGGFLQGLDPTPLDNSEYRDNDNGGFNFASGGAYDPAGGNFQRYETGTDLASSCTMIVLSLWDKDNTFWENFHRNLGGRVGLNPGVREVTAYWDANRWIKFGINTVNLSGNGFRCFFNVTHKTQGTGTLPGRPSNGSIATSFIFDVA